MIKNYFKIAIRGFARHKLFTLINIIGLSIGISAALVIYLIVHFDFTFDKFHPDGDRIYRVVTNYSFAGEPGSNKGVTGPLPEAIKNGVTGISTSAPFYTLTQNVLVPNKNAPPSKFKNHENIILADKRFFNVFKYKWLAGSYRTSLNAPYQVVLSSNQARIYFPKLSYDAMLGKQLIYEDTIKMTVTGIVQSFKERSDLDFNDFISYSTGQTAKIFYGNYLKEWGSTTSASQLFVKLFDKTAVANVERQLNALLKKNKTVRAEDKGNTQDFHLQPLSDVHFNEKYGTFDSSRVANKTTLYGLLAIAAFLLLLGCINFVNLTTAQAALRAKEIGIRKTMGSSRGQLIFQFFSETFLITLLAVLVSIFVAPLVLKLFSDFIPKGITADYIHQPDLVIFLIALTLLVSVFSGFYPAILLSGYKPALVLKNQTQSNSGKTRNAWLRKSLTVTQFVIAQFFIMATVLVSKQIYYALHKDMGFKKDAIVYLSTPWRAKDPGKKLVFMNKLRSIPQIDLVSRGGASPSSNNTNSTEATYLDGKKELKNEVQVKNGDSNYIRIYKIKLLAGRNLLPADTANALIINSTYARVLGFKTPGDAIGKYLIKFNGDTKRQIIGVVADFFQTSLHEPIKPLVILTDGKYNNSTFHIAFKPQTPGGDEWKTAIASIGKAWKEIYPDEDFEYHFFDESIAKFYESEQHTSTLLAWATGLSIFISCLGLLGLAIYTTNQRTKEIGVRKVLGASVSQIVTLLSTELVMLILLAFIVVTPIAWWAMHKWMQDFADHTTISWWIFAASGVGMLIASVFTSSFQTVKAAIANPVKSLRSE